MPRPAGESDKLGNRYEGVWTVDSLLDVLGGDASTLNVEPFGEDAHGVEFVKVRTDGKREFHSAKRQTGGNVWTLHALTTPERAGRSILGDLAEKLNREPNSFAVFVSGTTANALHEIWQRAERSQSFGAFEQNLATSGATRREFERDIVPFFQNAQGAYVALRRMRVVGITEDELIRRVEQRIRKDVYRPDGREFEPAEVRVLLGELIYHWFGQPLGLAPIREWLTQNGFGERDWSRDLVSAARVKTLIGTYLRHVEAELICDCQIERVEARQAFDLLHKEDRRCIAILGWAGLGKSCTSAQIIRLLVDAGVPCLPVRLDVQSGVLTARQLGLQLDLPESPAVALAGMANGRQCVLLLDQLDALSFASGRNQNLWDAFSGLLCEAEGYPNMRMVLVCREFDAEHDPRLRSLLADKQGTEVLKLQPLDIEAIKSAISRVGVRPESLSTRALQLLQTPLHLSLFLQGNPAQQPAFSNVQELLERYWEHKRRIAGPEVRWQAVIKRLADWLSSEQTLSAPHVALDELANDADRLCTLHVLVRDGNQFRFFHESFFDYCWGRIFVGEQRRLCDLLLGSEQHLFRRAQVRQVLAHKRGTMFQQYLVDLSDLLTEPGIRFHIKKLTLDWLRWVDEPNEQEWSVLQELQRGSPLWRIAMGVPHSKVPWFDLLLRTGEWVRWLESGDDEEVSRAIWLLSLKDVQRARSREIAALFVPYRLGIKLWKSQFSRIFHFGGVHYSREMFEFFLWAIRGGHQDDADSMVWYSCVDMATERPELAAELLGCLIEKTASMAHDEASSRLADFPDEISAKAAENAPGAFVHYVLPALIRASIPIREGSQRTPFGSFRWLSLLGEHCHDLESSLKSALNIAMTKLSREEPALLENLSIPLCRVKDNWAAMILLPAWGANSVFFADCGIDYLLEETARLNLGYVSWGSGNGRAAVGRNAVAALSPHCSQSRYELLEERILAFISDHEREEPDRAGYTSLLLLHCLPLTRMSVTAKERYKELRRMFPWEKFAQPRGIEAGFVGPPIEKAKLNSLSDRCWLAAMRKYDGVIDRPRKDFFKGGIHELAHALSRCAQCDKLRFANLALVMTNEINPAYFDAILRGILNEEKEQGSEEGLPESAFEQLDTGNVELVVKRLHALPEKPCGKAVCRAIERIARRSPSAEMFTIVSYYAMNDSDPEGETWKEDVGQRKMWGGDAHFQGMNSVRGVAAGAIADIVFAAGNLPSVLEMAAVAVIHDRSIAVRSCAVEILLAMLNFDRSRAVRLFLELCNGASDVLGTHFVAPFLYYACYDKYSDLRALILHMLELDHENAREAAAQQIAVAAFHEPLAMEDLQRLFSADVVCRKAIAGVFAANLKNPRTADLCRRYLGEMFDDPDKEVRGVAADCFRNLSTHEVALEAALINRFLESSACTENVYDLVRPLKDAVTELPEIVCRLPERLIEEQRSTPQGQHIEARRWTHDLPSLVARLYEQTADSRVKKRCLDIIDGMLELGFSEIEEELSRVDR